MTFETSSIESNSIASGLFTSSPSIYHHSNGTTTMINNPSPSVANVSEIAQFYRGRSVFITGATGFMGKVLVEKLLRSCPEIDSIYVLLRSKRGVAPRDRLNELLNAKIFDRLRTDRPNCLAKVQVIEGDITMAGLGISKDDIQMLIQRVSVVFHSAATVKFDEPLKASVEFNVLGTRRVVELCHRITNLACLVHVSTAYANCNRSEVDESLYPLSVDANQLIETVNWMDDKLLDKITPALLGDRPNTYTFTKALAESLLVRECGALPVAIVRPSIVTAAWHEPLPGWVDNINGPTGLILACGKGMLRTMYYDSEAIADLIPVDTVINMMIAVGWHTAVNRSNSIPIYNCASGSLNPITWGYIERVCLPLLIKYPSAQVFRYPGGCFKNYWILNQMSVLFEHHVPAYLMDGLLTVLRKPQIMRRLYTKLHRAVRTLQYFTTRQWLFQSNNVVELHKKLNPIDQQMFNFDIRPLDWDAYWRDYVLGARKFVLKEDDSTLPVARRNLTRRYYIGGAVQIASAIGAFQLLTYFSSSAAALSSLVTEWIQQAFQMIPQAVSLV